MKPLFILLLTTIPVGCYHIPADEKQSGTNQGENQQIEKKIPWGKINRYGLFKEHKRGSIQKDSRTGTGKVIRGVSLEFVESTHQIPLRKGVYFGYQYWLRLPPDRSRPELKRVLIHPEMTLPDGSKVNRSERTIRKRATYGIVTAIDAYALSEDYELVEGEWVFQIWYEDTMLAEQRFVTYRPDER